MLIVSSLLFFQICNAIKKSEVTLVTGYFELEEYKTDWVPRNREAYFEYFKKWARIKNDLVVVCQNKQIKDEILSIRKGFGLEERTEVLILEDVFSMDKVMYDDMVKISKDPFFIQFRKKRSRARANNPRFVYIQNMKSFFLHKAKSEFSIKTQNMAWLDFGFDHGGELYLSEEDWRFTLQCDLLDKVTLFLKRNEHEQKSILELIGMDEPQIVDGSCFVCPTSLVDDLYLTIHQLVFSLLKVGLMETDQLIFLYAVRSKPKMFEIKYLYGTASFIKQHCNGEHMRYEDNGHKRRAYVRDLNQKHRVTEKKNGESKKR